MAAELPASLTHLICFFSHNDRPDQSKAGAGQGESRDMHRGRGRGRETRGAEQRQHKGRPGKGLTSAAPTWMYCRVPNVPPAGVGAQKPRPSMFVLTLRLSCSQRPGVADQVA